MLAGIRDENDRAYSPKIVRIGLKPHHSVQAVSMDYLVRTLLPLNLIVSTLLCDLSITGILFCRWNRNLRAWTFKVVTSRSKEGLQRIKTASELPF